MTQNGANYQAAGVDVRLGDALSQRASERARQTYRSEVSEIGGVPIFDVRFGHYTNPIMLGATDGVGTKLELAQVAGRHDTVGVDLVAMSVNDIVRRGGEPLIFLPYFATGKLDPKIADEVSQGVMRGCRLANCSVLGGETAEMAGFYDSGKYDLAGASVGVVERDKIITGAAIQAGDAIIGLTSSGLHSNGFSLVRRVLFETRKYDYYAMLDELNGWPLIEVLLEPTRIYVRSILNVLAEDVNVHGIAHITGGGLGGKLRKIFPPTLKPRVDRSTWTPQPIFEVIQHAGAITDAEMYATFNMGIGMVVVVPEADAERVVALFEAEAERAYHIGTVVAA